MAIETAKYYIKESKLSADFHTCYYREKITDAPNYIFTEYLKLHIFELLNYLVPKIDEEIFKGLNNDGKQFFKMKFETFLLKKGFPFRQSKHITESQIEGKFELPKIDFYLAKYEGIYLDFDYKSVTLNSDESKIFMEEINNIKSKFNNLISLFNYIKININHNNNNNEEENLENNHPEKNININSKSEFTTKPTEDIIENYNNNYGFSDVSNFNICEEKNYHSDNYNSNNFDSDKSDSELFFDIK